MDPEVDEDDDAPGDPEGDDSGDDGEVLVHHQVAGRRDCRCMTRKVVKRQILLLLQLNCRSFCVKVSLLSIEFVTQ